MKKFFGILSIVIIIFMLCIRVNAEETTEKGEDRGIIEHEVLVVISKTDETGAPLSGATLQIIDSNGTVVDEWVSDGTSHEIMLLEGIYTLHEVSAPEGYIKANDKVFEVKVEVIDLDAGVDFSKTPCEHYGGTPLYYVEIDGEKSEVYCINQDWETPDEGSKYDGEILHPDDIRDFTKQTVYVDPQQNKELRDISDQSLTSKELYDKLLDIIYHRQLASTIFDDLNEAEIRYITEAALKNYTNAGLTRVQGVTSKSALPEGVGDNYYYDGVHYWYLYTHFRSFKYLPDAEMGEDIFTTIVDKGDAFGSIARHWDAGDHNAKNDPVVRAKIHRFYELFEYLISDEDPHPDDMYLYVYGTINKAAEWSHYNFDYGVYQNLLGIRWYIPKDDHKIELECINYKEDTGKTEIVPPVTMVNSSDSNNYLLVVLVLFSLGLCFKKRFN